MPRTDEQQRARKAWDCVSSINNTETAPEYLTITRKFPVMVLTNGLGQSLAFLKAKNKAHHQALYNHLSTWVLGQIKLGDGQRGTDLLTSILQQESEWYRRATAETLAFAGWLKRFAEAELSED